MAPRGARLVGPGAPGEADPQLQVRVAQYRRQPRGDRRAGRASAELEREAGRGGGAPAPGGEQAEQAGG